MPDRLTIVAATPKCAEPMDRADRESPQCGLLLRWTGYAWACPEHGVQVSGSRQAAKLAVSA